MKKIIFFLLFLSSTFAYAQYDTNFWFAVPPIVPTYTTVLNKPFYLRLMTKDKPAHVKISMPANSSFKPIEVDLTPYSLENVNLSSFIEQIESREINKVLNRGLNIDATNNVIAYLDLVSSPADAEFYSLKGEIGLGNYFIVPGQKFYQNHDAYSPLPKNTVIIIASEDSSIIYITPSNNAVGHSENNRFNIILNKGQTYCIESESQLSSKNLTGTIIESYKPISVMMNDDLVSYSYCQDALGDQIIPLKSWGIQYAVVPGDLMDEKLLIISSENNNNIVINDKLIKTLSRNELFYYDLGENSFIKSTYPIYVFHITGANCELSATTILPFTCSGIKKIDYIFDRVTYPNNDLICNIIVNKIGINNFYLNDTTKLKGDFSPIGNSTNLYSGKIYLQDYPYNQVFELSNKTSSFSIGFLIGGGDTPGAKYVYLNDMQNDERYIFNIMLPQLNLHYQDSIVNIPFWIKTEKGLLPTKLQDLSFSFKVNENIISPITLKYGSFTEEHKNGSLYINCHFPLIQLNNELELIDTLVCSINKNASGFNQLIWSNSNLNNEYCNTIKFTNGYLNFKCGDYSFAFDDFSNIDDIYLGAYARKHNDYIRLTTNQIYKVGTMFFKYKLSLDYSFTTTFRFRLLDGFNSSCTDNSAPGADGLAFVITSNKNSVGLPGGGIGYDGINNAFVLEFDTFSNDSTQIETFYDPNGNHAAIQYCKNGQIHAKHLPEYNLAMNKDIIPINSTGTIYYCKIDYDDKTKTLDIYFDSTGQYRNKIIELHDFDFSKYLQLDNNSAAYLGFTAATGCAAEYHDLLYWDFCSTKPGKIVAVEEESKQMTTNENQSYCCSNKVKIDKNLGIINKIQIFDLYGRLIPENVTISDDFIILSNSLPVGLYLIQIKTNTKSKIFKILILEK